MTTKIRTLEELREHLEDAVQLELAVIPPYLCALYTLQPGANGEVSQIIRSVVVEEMLHMILSANVLNAVGGHPKVTGDFAPVYPALLPDGVEAHLLPFNEAALETFLKIEEPSRPHVVLEAALVRRAARPLRVALRKYPTIGEFYQAIIDGLENLVAELGEPAVFTGDPGLQIGPELYYSSGGHAIVVHDLATARAALEQVIDQGEGETHSLYDGEGNLAHFFRYMEVKYQRRYRPDQREAIRLGHFPEPDGEPFPVSYEAVYPMLPDPRTEDYEGELRAASEAFNVIYSRLLQEIETAFSGEPDLLLPAVGTMFELKYKALELMRAPLPSHPGYNAGPTFEFVSPG